MPFVPSCPSGKMHGRDHCRSRKTNESQDSLECAVPLRPRRDNRRYSVGIAGSNLVAVQQPPTLASADLRVECSGIVCI